MFLKQMKTAPTKVDAAEIFRRDLADAIKAAHDAGLSYRTTADVLEEKTQAERISDATSSTPASVRYDAKTLRPIVD
jgi:hypothetical protein